MAEPFLAEIKLFGFNFAPRGWALCDGQILPINQNQSLFSLLGTTYGGDGRTTFGLPELRGRSPLHASQKFRLGSKGGEERHILTAAEMPQHTHLQQASNDLADQHSPAKSTGEKLVLARSQATDPIWAAPNNVVNMAEDSVATAGGGQAHENMPPYTTVTFCIAIRGLFPSRN